MPISSTVNDPSFLKNIAYKIDLLTSLIANGNLVLEGIKPTLIITGSGGANTAANSITFNFSAAIKDGSFTVDDIGLLTAQPPMFWLKAVALRNI
jgi:hypothetical protein